MNIDFQKLFSADTKTALFTLLRYLLRNPDRFEALIAALEQGKIPEHDDYEAGLVLLLSESVKADTESVEFMRALMRLIREIE